MILRKEGWATGAEKLSPCPLERELLNKKFDPILTPFLTVGARWLEPKMVKIACLIHICLDSRLPGYSDGLFLWG